MSKHTPGPWNVTTESFGRIYVSTIIEGSVSVVAECWPVGYYKNDEQEANARLIAKSPALFDLLKSAVENPDDPAYWLYTAEKIIQELSE